MSGKRTDGIISRHINRKFSTRITNFIVSHNLPITPNQVSIISFLIGIFASFLYLVSYPVIAGVLVQISSIVDGVDGELARATNRSSKVGGFFDTILDRFVDISVVVAFSLFTFFHQGQVNILTIIVAFLALSGTLMVSYLHSASRLFLNVHPVETGKVISFASRDVRLFLIFLGSVFSLICNFAFVATLFVIAIITNFYTIVGFVSVLRYTSKNSIYKN
ncbi:MAG: CDP-alcohol phosphatidyltransferase family protein [Candidatus Asgardarchaeia archaeon]